MLPDLLDRYQLKAKRAIRENDLLIIHGDSDTGKSHFLNHLVADRVTSGQRVLFLTSENQKIKAAQRFLKPFGLGPHSLVVQQNEIVSQAMKDLLIREIKQKSKSIVNPVLLAMYSDYEYAKKVVERHYEVLNRQLLFDKSWHELLALQAFDKNTVATLHYNEILQPNGFQFEPENYDDLLDTIVQAFDWVSEDLASTDRLFDSTIYNLENEDQAWLTIEQWIVEARKKTTKLIIALSRFMDDYAKNRKQLFLEKIAAFKKQMEEIGQAADRLQRQKESENVQTKGRSLFGNRQKEKKEWQVALDELAERFFDSIAHAPEEVSQYLLTEKETDSSSITDLLSLTTSVTAIKQRISELRPSMMQWVRQKLDALNPNQSENSQLQHLESEVQELYKWINQTSRINQEYENTAFSVSKKLKQLETLLADLNYFASLEHGFKRFFEWNRFYYAQSAQAQYLIDKLLLIRPADWIAFFRNWYVQNTIELNRSLFDEQVDEKLDTIHELLDAMPSIGAETFNRIKVGKMRELRENKIDANLTGLLKRLGSKSEPPIDWNELIAGYSRFVTTQFPVIFASEEEAAQWPKQNWDLVIVCRAEFEKNELENLSKFGDQGKKTVLSIDQPQLETALKNEIYSKGFHLVTFKGHHQQAIIDMAEMNHSERLYAARNLAFLLEDLNPGLTVFHLEDYILFSCFSNTLNTVMMKLLDNRSIKKVRVLESPFHLIVENLLEIKSNRVLITQDGLINNRCAERLDWQLLVMDRVKKAGIRIVDFKSEQLLKNPVQEMIRFLQTHFPQNNREVSREKGQGKSD